VNERLCAEVALPVPVEGTFDYALPPGVTSLRAGARVRVPHGPRQLVGTVVSLRARPPRAGERPLQTIAEVLDVEVTLPERLVGVLVDAARDSLTPPGLALAAALPAGTLPRAAPRFSLGAAGRRALERSEAPGSLRAMLAELGERPLGEPALRRRFPGAAPALERCIRLGWVERTDRTAPARARARTERVYALDAARDLETARRELRRFPARLALLEKLHAGSASLPASSALRALCGSGWVRIEEREVLRAPSTEPIAAAQSAPPTLTAHQRAAVDAVSGAIDARQARTFLLYGITGSGKTEVYLHAAARALSIGRAVIALVPEISLTHQVVDRFRARFGDRIAVLHSGLGPGERFDQWRQIARGAHAIAIGARSAIFAPFVDVGLIVIDEEHEAAYHSEDSFHYDARAVAERLARAHGCPLLLGSATPDIATAHRAQRREIERLTLPERVAQRPLPEVEIVDLAQEPRGRGPIRALSRALRKALADTLAAREQAILFLNRRGFASGIYCPHCGHARRCKQCDVGLVYHATGAPARTDRAEQGELRCHYCGYSEDPCTRCPGCDRPDGALVGFGTERIEEEVAAAFPHARVARLDRDSSSRKGEQRRILAEFHRGETDVLVGTQMVAKGHDVPSVTLVGVIAADLGLHFPDYRAGERTFQLLTQVAGRAGRGARPGRVVIQTFLPDHYAIALARSHDYPSFLREELARREPHGYPPFRALALLDVSGTDAEAVEGLAEALAQLARGSAGDRGVEVLGPAPAPLARVRGRYRWHLLLLGPPGPLRDAARELARNARARARQMRVRVVLSPTQML
jgi:primosomal protein N' (replication factor Y) (superfamily II helicase)